MVAALLCYTIIIAQEYCDISFVDNSVGIKEVKFAENEFFGWSHEPFYPGEANYKNYETNPSYWMYVQRGVSYPITVETTREELVSAHVFVMLDFDDDGEFDIISDLGIQTGTDYVHSDSILFPATSTTGYSRIRVIVELSNGIIPSFESCGQRLIGSAIDYRVVVRNDDPMQYEGFELKAIKNPIDINNSRDEYLIGINIKTTGGGDNLGLSQVWAECNTGSTDFLTDAEYLSIKYSKGHNSAFSFTRNASDEVSSINAPHWFYNLYQYQNHLLPGDNWFWFKINLKSGASIGHVLHIDITSITLNNGGSLTTIPLSTATTSREIVDLGYCVDAAPHPRGLYHVDSVRISNLNFSNFEPQSKALNTYQNSFLPYEAATDLCVGTSYTLNVKHQLTNTVPSDVAVHAYFDWNQNGSFNDENEHYLLGHHLNTPLENFAWSSALISPPGNAKEGLSVMRIITANQLSPDPCNSVGEIQDFGYYLHKNGDLSLSNPSSFLLEPSSLQLNANNTSTDFAYQQSVDGENWNLLANAVNQTSFSTPSIDTTTLFRLVSDNDACPNTQVYSNVIRMPYLGLNSLPDSVNLCLNDTFIIDVNQAYPAFSFINNERSINPNPLEFTQSSIDVSGINQAMIDRISLDSVCFTITYQSQVTAYLIPPNRNEEVRIRLAEDISYTDPNGNGLNTAKFCFVNDPDNHNPVMPNDSPGVYQSIESLDRLFNTDPNGSWTLAVFSDDETSNEIIESFSMHFGLAQTLHWTPDSSQLNQDTGIIKLSTNVPETYTLSLQHRYGSVSDSIFVRPVSGNDVLLDLINPSPAQLCEGNAITLEATISTPDFKDDLVWKRNGLIAAYGPTYLSNQFNHLDQVSVSFNLEASCKTFAESEEITLAIKPVLTPTANLLSNLTPPLCHDQREITLFADTANFGNVPGHMKWFINDKLIQEHGQLFTYTNLQPFDTIHAIITGNVFCLSDSIITVSNTPEFADAPNAGFSYQKNDLSIICSPADSILTIYLWDFGDGNQLEQTTTQYTYQNEGAYNLCLTVKDSLNCAQTHCETIDMVLSNLIQHTANKNITLYPNPTTQFIALNNPNYTGNYLVVDYTGKKVLSGLLDANERINVHQLPKGNYVFILHHQQQTIALPFVKQ